MPTKTIKVPEDKKGWIIGRQGCTIKEIQEKTGAVIDARYKYNMVSLKGERTQIDAAERRIQKILSGNTSFMEDSLLVTVPEFAVGFIIGRNKRNLNDIEEETKAQIFQAPNREPCFYVKGNAVQRYKAKLKIKEKASNCRRLNGFEFFKKFPFIDDRHVGEDSDFTLKLNDNPHPRWSGPHYELVSGHKQHLQQEKDSQDFSKLCGKIQNILQSLQERDDSENLLVDMWCHYGHAYITRVEEVEEDQVYSLQEVKQNLKRENCPWLGSFIGGVRDLDVRNIEKLLLEDSRNQGVPHYTRCDLSFFSPSCRQIRVKIFVKAGGENGEDLVFCDDDPVQVKNVLEKVSHDNGPAYYLCAPPVHHIKVHIFIPFVNLDCHFMMRTTFRNFPRTPEEEAEDKVLIDFLNQNLKIIDGELKLPTRQEELPDGFDLSYWRQSKRRTYFYNGFKIKISEETLENVNGFETGDDIRKRNDIHIHCNEWDEQFSGGEWQPEQIVKRVPGFFSFVRVVQENIATDESGQEE